MKKLSKTDRDLVKAFATIGICLLAICSVIYVAIQPPQDILHRPDTQIGIAIICASLVGLFLLHADFNETGR